MSKIQKKVMKKNIVQKGLVFCGNKGLLRFLPDKFFLKIEGWAMSGEIMDINNPKTFNEKMQWLKLHDKNPKYTEMVDKYEVKKHISDILGQEYCIPTLGVWDKFEDINFSILPNQFVLKSTHDSGGIVVVSDKKTFDAKKARKLINRSLRRNYYDAWREWPYKNVKPRIIAEKYVEDESGCELKDYKMFVFGGKVHCIQVDYNRFTDHKRNFYDLNWNYIPFTTCYQTDEKHNIDRPQCLDELIQCAEKIATELETPPFLRVDMYVVYNKIHFIMVQDLTDIIQVNITECLVI